MNLGIMCSAGGGVLKELFVATQKYFPGQFDYHVVIDRDSELETFCHANDIGVKKIICKDNDELSCKSSAFFSANAVDVVLLFFLRLVRPSIYEQFLTFNFHPSLLPAYQGFRPLERALGDGYKYIGATLHRVDASIDGGPIVAQMIFPFSGVKHIDDVHKVSFLQKTYCSFLLIDSLLRGDLGCPKKQQVVWNDADWSSLTSQPALKGGKFMEAFHEIQHREGVVVVR